MKRKAEENENEAKRVRIEPKEEDAMAVVPEVEILAREDAVEMQVNTETMPEVCGEQRVEEEPEGQTVQVVPPTPASGKTIGGSDEGMEEGTGEGETGIAELKEGTEEREFEPDLEVELDPEPEEAV